MKMEMISLTKQITQMFLETVKSKSSLGIKYPSLRDDPLHLVSSWLEGKRKDDGAEDLWRIQDNLYDLTDFIKSHPGGEDWIKLTKGTDITEAFETHHLSDVPETILPKYFTRKAKTPRNFPFTFHETDFYKVLKRNIYNELCKLPTTSSDRSKFLTDVLFFSYVTFAFLAVYFKSFVFGAISGVSLSLTAIAAHNFFHQKDNFRMYYFDFSMMSSKEWRITHALSHHMYTNTINDYEISVLEPFLQYLPKRKGIFFKYISWIYSPIVYAVMFPVQLLKRIVQLILDKGESFSWTIFLPFVVPTAAFIITKQSLPFCVLMFLWIILAGSLHFGVVGVNAAHHHPDLFHDGDCPRPKEDMDWGIYQVDAVMDRKDITGSHFLVLTNFGDHALHHLFPTIDHGLLQHLYPVFIKTCQEFGVEWRIHSQLELVKGQYKQLAKTEPRKNPPKSIIRKTCY